MVVSYWVFLLVYSIAECDLLITNIFKQASFLQWPHNTGKKNKKKYDKNKCVNKWKLKNNEYMQHMKLGQSTPNAELRLVTNR